MEGYSFLLALVTSVLGSGIFLLILILTKSGVQISPHISVITDKASNKKRYFIKVINFSTIKQFEVQYHLNRVERSYSMTSGGVNVRVVPMKLGRTEQITMSGNLLFKWLRNTSDWTARNCRLIEVLEDLESDWKDADLLEFSVTSKNGFSGLSNHVVKKYLPANNLLKAGKFQHGTSFKIDKDNIYM